MGNQSSKGLSVENILKQFSQDEQNKITLLFSKFSQGRIFFTSRELQLFETSFSRRFCLAASLLHVKEGNNASDNVDLYCFVKALSILLKEDEDENGLFLFSMLGCTDTVISNKVLKGFLNDISSQFHQSIEKTTEYQSCAFQLESDSIARLTCALFFDLFCKRKNVKELWENSEENFEEPEIKALLSRESLLAKCLRFVFSSDFSILENQPPCLLPKFFGDRSTLLDLASVLMLNQNLPVHLNREWHLLYSTHYHGESFSTLLGKVLQKGPSLIIIRDKEGHVFGGFASLSWDFNPRFTGGETCFVFTLSPEPIVFSSTGYNTNFMYLSLHQHTLPNGMGFGGQLNNFGLFVDSELEGGHSIHACSTYASPQLSGSRQFILDSLEAWGVGTPVETNDKLPKKSVLDADVGTKALMTMVNKVGVSDAIREEDKQIQAHAELRSKS